MIKPTTVVSALAAMVCITGLICSVTGLASTETTGEAHEPVSERPGESYLPGDALASISAAKESAMREDKLVLVVMGANWCHDSRALASRMEIAPLSDIVSQHYETVFVDVGHLNQGRDVINSLGLPAYYATPTVLIVDPASGNLVNADNRHRWANAANISMEESVLYFKEFASTDLAGLRADDNSPEILVALLADIDKFETRQADRLYDAYAVLTPMLEAFEQGDKAQFSQKTWDEVRQFRYKLAADMDALRIEAEDKVAAGETDIQLEYPTYPAFSWE